jgi:hypothetical protein
MCKLHYFASVGSIGTRAAKHEENSSTPMSFSACTTKTAKGNNGPSGIATAIGIPMVWFSLFTVCEGTNNCFRNFAATSDAVDINVFYEIVATFALFSCSKWSKSSFQ